MLSPLDVKLARSSTPELSVHERKRIESAITELAAGPVPGSMSDRNTDAASSGEFWLSNINNKV